MEEHAVIQMPANQQASATPQLSTASAEAAEHISNYLLTGMHHSTREGRERIATLVQAAASVTQDARCQKLRAELQAVIDGCVHPDTAKRRVMVDLAPIRAALRETQTQ